MALGACYTKQIKLLRPQSYSPPPPGAPSLHQ